MSAPNDTDPAARPLWGSTLADEAEEDDAERDGLSEAQRVARDEANALLSKFAKVRPPAPEPKQRAESNGDPFVAYEGVHRPAISARPHITTPGVRIEQLHAMQAEAEERGSSSRSSRTDATTPLSDRRARARVIVLASIALGLIGLLVSIFWFVRSEARGPDIESNKVDSIPAPPSVVPHEQLDIPPPPPAPTMSAVAPVTSATVPDQVHVPAPHTPQPVSPRPTPPVDDDAPKYMKRIPEVP